MAKFAPANPQQVANQLPSRAAANHKTVALSYVRHLRPIYDFWPRRVSQPDDATTTTGWFMQIESVTTSTCTIITFNI